MGTCEKGLINIKHNFLPLLPLYEAPCNVVCEIKLHVLSIVS